MAIKLDGSMGQLVDEIAERFADRVLPRLGEAWNGLSGRGNGRRSSALHQPTARKCVKAGVNSGSRSAGYALPLPRLQQPLEGTEIPLSLRGAPEACPRLRCRRRSRGRLSKC